MALDGQVTIEEFLLSFAGAGGPDLVDHPVQTVFAADRSSQDRTPYETGLSGARLRAEVMRHRSRTMTIVSMGGNETMTRCPVCPKNDSPPCDGLRLLALPYNWHPAYRPEWHIDPARAHPGEAGV